ncbi:MAG: hypothetical protein HYY08_02650 [Firmicutes bacterium]|nr:hypothetical protein [Bacillota bacterium]
MESVRCLCGKLTCQITGDSVVIKCRRCKRLVTIETKGVLHVSFGDEAVEESCPEERRPELTGAAIRPGGTATSAKGGDLYGARASGVR